MKPWMPGFVIKSPPPWLKRIPKATELLGAVSPPTPLHRKSNHFLNGPADAEGRLISSPRGRRHPQEDKWPSSERIWVILLTAIKTSSGLWQGVL